MTSELLTRLEGAGPKRVLALDGGGIRGILTLAFLQRIQTVLRERHGDPSLLLADYFDLIGGTSTGAIIAAALAMGMDADEVTALYTRVGASVFSRRRLLPYNAMFDAGPLEHELQSAFGERTLGDSSLRTGLCIVTKRADTRSTWPLLNHPRGQFYEQNRLIPLRAAVRASAAAPGFFEPQMVDVGGEQGLFVDGGVSMACNPALQLFMVATLQGFPFRWPTGESRLLIVSVGTGSWSDHTPPEAIAGYRIWNWAAELPRLLIEDSIAQAELVLQCLSRSATARRIDSEIGDLGDDLWSGEPALSYLRYNVRLEDDELHALGVELPVPVREIRPLHAAAHRDLLYRVGGAAAAERVAPHHFAPAFDLPGRGARLERQRELQKD